MNKYDVLIIGCGPAGLFTAINCYTKGKKIAILEKKDTGGKKLLLSGAGQCNLTHTGDINHFLSSYGKNGRFLRKSLYAFTNNNLTRFFRERGIDFITTKKGKIFPKSLKAKDILNTLLSECKDKNIDIFYSAQIKSIDKSNNSFHIKTNDEIYNTKNLVIATGGTSYKNTGSTGDGYIYARKFGHKIITPKPALTPVIIKNYEFKDISGVSLENIEVSLYRENKKVNSFIGDILFTHTGLSGPVIINNSRYIKNGDTIRCNLINENPEDFKITFLKRINENSKHFIKTIIKDYNIPKSLTNKVISLNNLDDIKCASLTKKDRNLLISLLTNYSFEIKELCGYHQAMVTSGGVRLDEINNKSMESKLINNLFFVGEVLDIDGDTGGYNLQAAFSTAFLAGQSIKKHLKHIKIY